MFKAHVRELQSGLEEFIQRGLAGKTSAVLPCEGHNYTTKLGVQAAAASLVEAAISERVRRENILPAHLFADPAWDMLLELYRAELGKYGVSVSNLCVASRVPATTSLRWIGTLASEGLVTRDADQFDRRRFYVRLTETGSKAMWSYFSRELVAPEVQQ